MADQAGGTPKEKSERRLIFGLRPWWKSWYHGPVSGRYQGHTADRLLRLRVDIDPVRPHSPVMNCLSGDIYRWWDGRDPDSEEDYLESWIAKGPKVRWSRERIEIDATAHFWHHGFAKHRRRGPRVHVEIPWSADSRPGPAVVRFLGSRGKVRSFVCDWTTASFRDLKIEVDVSASVADLGPEEPGYDTRALPGAVGLPKRFLSLKGALKDAGIRLSVDCRRGNVIPDSRFGTWSPEELNQVMQQWYDGLGGNWPDWRAWGFIAGRSEEHFQFNGQPFDVRGEMFDVPGFRVYRPEARPARQGFAIFRASSQFAKLSDKKASSEDRAKAERLYLWAWVHEIGHLLGLRHSWEMRRLSALSWMNYPEKVNRYWGNFPFSFDHEELIHLRHGNRNEVIPGGPRSTTSPRWRYRAHKTLQLHLRSKGTFEYMEPVAIEFRIKLIGRKDSSVDVPLDPSFGNTSVDIRPPDGEWRRYIPCVLREISRQEAKTGVGLPRILKPILGDAEEGIDRYSEEVFLGFDARGFPFRKWGTYELRAEYFPQFGSAVPSNAVAIRIEKPLQDAEKELAKRSREFFRPGVGLALYLGGSRSPRRQADMEVLRKIHADYRDRALGQEVGRRIAQTYLSPAIVREEGTGVRVKEPGYSEFLDLTKDAMNRYRALPDRKEAARVFNLSYCSVACDSFFAKMSGDPDPEGRAQARKDWEDHWSKLRARGVNPSVLEERRRIMEQRLHALADAAPADDLANLSVP